MIYGVEIERPKQIDVLVEDVYKILMGEPGDDNDFETRREPWSCNIFLTDGTKTAPIDGTLPHSSTKVCSLVFVDDEQKMYLGFREE